VVGIDANEIQYMPTKEAIKQRFVDLDEVALYESMGVCFGRKAEEYKPTTKSISGKIERYM